MRSSVGACLLVFGRQRRACQTKLEKKRSGSSRPDISINTFSALKILTLNLPVVENSGAENRSRPCKMPKRYGKVGVLRLSPNTWFTHLCPNTSNYCNCCLLWGGSSPEGLRNTIIIIASYVYCLWVFACPIYCAKYMTPAQKTRHADIYRKVINYGVGRWCRTHQLSNNVFHNLDHQHSSF